MCSPDLLELPLADPISVEDDAVRLEPGALVEVDEHLPHHGSQLGDDLLAVVLDSDRGTVATGMGIHAGHQLGGGGGGGGGAGRRGGIIHVHENMYTVHKVTYCTCIN